MGLLDSIDSTLEKYGFAPISKIIDNKKACFQYINQLLLKAGNNIEIPDVIQLNEYDFRIKHVLLSFGLGFLLAEFNGLKERIDVKYHNINANEPFAYVWLMLCLYHDYGYFIKPFYENIETFYDIVVLHRIFDFNYCKSRYSFNLYVEYFNERHLLHLKKDNNRTEVGDHGILGGYVLFDKLYESIINKEKIDNEKDVNIIPFYQDLCYRIMEHNVWKQNTNYEKDHAYYEISSENFRIIDNFEPLLYVLSLVDTIEMTKKFCKNPEKNSSRSVRPTKIASQFEVNVCMDEIVIDYSNLEPYLKKNHYKQNDVASWVNSVKGLEDWVDLVSTNDEREKKILIGLAK